MPISDADVTSSLRRRITTARNPHVDASDEDDREGRSPNDVRFIYRPSFPAHRNIKESPLSSDAIFKQSHAVLLNLCVIVVIAINSRLIIENLMKYGLLIRAGFWFSSKSLRDWPLLMCCLTFPVFALAAFLVEKLVLKNSISERMVVWLHIIISTVAVLYPVSVILRCDSAVQSGVILMLFTCIVWMKMVGNMVFWLFFSILGRPMCLLLYYHDVMNRRGNAR